VTFCGYTVFPDRDNFVSRFSFRDENSIELSDALGIIFVELTKLSEVIKKPVSDMTGEEAWASFFAYASDPDYRDLISKLITERKEIKMAEEMLHTISKDEIERARFRSRHMFQMDLQDGLLTARGEGLAEGLAIGRAEGRTAVAKSMLNEGIPTEMIIKVTGLTHREVEQIRSQT